MILGFTGDGLSRSDKTHVAKSRIRRRSRTTKTKTITKADMLT